MRILFIIRILLLFAVVHISGWNGAAQINFQAYHLVPLEVWIGTVTIGDINNDGLQDLIIGTEEVSWDTNAAKIMFYRQLPGGGFATPTYQNYPRLGTGLQRILIEDINDDGLNDVIVGHNDSLGFILQDDNGQLSQMQSVYSSKTVTSISAGDMDNDGQTDIVVYHGSQGGLRIFHWANNTMVGQAINCRAGGIQVEVADINGDSLPDIVCAFAGYARGIDVYLQNSNGSFDPPATYYITSGYPIWSIAVGDLNSDGLTDVFAATGLGLLNDPICIIWYQDTSTHLLVDPPQEVSTITIPHHVAVDDLNCDGINELIVFCSSSDVRMFQAIPGGGFNLAASHATPSFMISNNIALATGDMNNDGITDVVTTGMHGAGIFINNSKPNSYDFQDTITSIDTIQGSIITNTFSYTSLVLDTTGNIVTATLDSFVVTTQYTMYEIYLDTIIYRWTSFCGGIVYDTLYFSDIYEFNDDFHADTIRVSSKQVVLNIQDNIQIFPNPTSDMIWLVLPYPYDQVGTLLSIYDLSGRLVGGTSFNTEGNCKELQLGYLADGLYSIYLESFRMRSVVKVTVLHQ
jgi:hypothetical protein